MPIYIKSFRYDNCGPLRNVKIDCDFHEDGRPKPLFLVGKNGSGKSIALSNVVDSMYEAGRIAYDNAAKSSGGVEQQYFKAISPIQITVGHRHMCSHVSYTSGAQYIFKSGQYAFNDYRKANPEVDASLDWLNANGNFKKTTFTEEQAKELFEKQVVCYFDPHRYEKPVWLGDLYYETNGSHLNEEISLSIEGRYTRELRNPIIPENCTLRNRAWLLDVIADSRADVELKTNTNTLATCSTTNVNNILFFKQARQNVEKVLSAIIQQDVILNLRHRGYGLNRLQILYADSGEVYAPSLDSLSTGQIALFDIFTTIIRYGDNNNPELGTSIDSIVAVVVIDEADLHLHTTHQYDVLPELIKLFPQVQFVISTHSPLLLLGMAAHLGEDAFDIYEMPSGLKIYPESYSEFGTAYDAYSATEAFHAELCNINLGNSNKALVITEGTTDWRHLEAAYNHFKRSDDAAFLPDSDKFEFFKFGPKGDEKCTRVLEMGGPELAKLCQYSSLTPSNPPLIFISDSDNNDVTKTLKGEPFKDWGNNVYSFVLPTPSFRDGGVSIELMYSDADLRKSILCDDGIKRRLYLSTEFDRAGRSVTNEPVLCNDLNKCRSKQVCIIDSQVLPTTANDDKEHALSKIVFANAILEGQVEVDFSEFVPVLETIQAVLDTIFKDMPHI